MRLQYGGGVQHEAMATMNLFKLRPDHISIVFSWLFSPGSLQHLPLTFQP